ncbi:unnamed protein product [Amoebophrya sp. A120]|nr:unnamed protein product [Amoebophrya sp. A120]|eukprot:GSA120T00004384001.1
MIEDASAARAGRVAGSSAADINKKSSSSTARNRNVAAAVDTTGRGSALSDRTVGAPSKISFADLLHGREQQTSSTSSSAFASVFPRAPDALPIASTDGSIKAVESASAAAISMEQPASGEYNALDTKRGAASLLDVGKASPHDVELVRRKEETELCRVAAQIQQGGCDSLLLELPRSLRFLASEFFSDHRSTGVFLQEPTGGIIGRGGGPEVFHDNKSSSRLRATSQIEGFVRFPLTKCHVALAGRYVLLRFKNQGDLTHAVIATRGRDKLLSVPKAPIGGSTPTGSRNHSSIKPVSYNLYAGNQRSKEHYEESLFQFRLSLVKADEVLQAATVYQQNPVLMRLRRIDFLPQVQQHAQATTTKLNMAAQLRRKFFRRFAAKALNFSPETDAELIDTTADQLEKQWDRAKVVREIKVRALPATSATPTALGSGAAQEQMVNSELHNVNVSRASNSQSNKRARDEGRTDPQKKSHFRGDCVNVSRSGFTLSAKKLNFVERQAQLLHRHQAYKVKIAKHALTNGEVLNKAKSTSTTSAGQLSLAMQNMTDEEISWLPPKEREQIQKAKLAAARARDQQRALSRTATGSGIWDVTTTSTSASGTKKALASLTAAQQQCLFGNDSAYVALDPKSQSMWINFVKQKKTGAETTIGKATPSAHLVPLQEGDLIDLMHPSEYDPSNIPFPPFSFRYRVEYVNGPPLLDFVLEHRPIYCRKLFSSLDLATAFEQEVVTGTKSSLKKSIRSGAALVDVQSDPLMQVHCSPVIDSARQKMRFVLLQKFLCFSFLRTLNLSSKTSHGVVVPLLVEDLCKDRAHPESLQEISDLFPDSTSDADDAVVAGPSSGIEEHGNNVDRVAGPGDMISGMKMEFEDDEPAAQTFAVEVDENHDPPQERRESVEGSTVPRAAQAHQENGDTEQNSGSQNVDPMFLQMDAEKKDELARLALTVPLAVRQAQEQEERSHRPPPPPPAPPVVLARAASSSPLPSPAASLFSKAAGMSAMALPAQSATLSRADPPPPLPKSVFAQQPTASSELQGAGAGASRKVMPPPPPKLPKSARGTKGGAGVSNEQPAAATAPVSNAVDREDLQYLLDALRPPPPPPRAPR